MFETIKEIARKKISDNTINTKKTFKSDVVGTIKDEKQLMRLNKILSNTAVVKVLLAGIDLIIFVVSNVILNAVLNFKNFKILKAVFVPIIFAHPVWIIVTAIIIVIVDVRLWYLIKVNYKDNNIGQKGEAKWTTLDEIKTQYKCIPEKNETYEGNGGVPVCRCDHKIYIDDSPVNNLVIGITRSGKGEMFVFPTIDIYSRAEYQPSLVVTDPKLELAPASADILKKRGYEVYVLNLDNPILSMGYNPLQLIVDAYKKGDFDDAELLCNSFCYSIFNPSEEGSGAEKDPFWANTSKDLLSAAIWAHIDDCLKADEKINIRGLYDWKKKQNSFDALSDEEKERIRIEISNLADENGEITNNDLKHFNQIPPEFDYVETHKNEQNINMYSIINTINELAGVKVNEFTTGLDIYFSERPALDRAKMRYSSVTSAGSKTKGSIFSNTLAKLTIFTSEKIAKMTAESTIDLRDVGFGKKPMAIFLGIPDYDSSNHFLASVFIRQLYFALAKAATNNKSGKCDREVVFLLDEFGNLPAIENMSHIITVSLGRKIRFDLIIQAYSQIEKLYGKDAETIIGNCGNQFYIQTNDKETAEHFSALLGNETITNVNRVGQKLSLNKSITEMYDEKPLLNPVQLTEIAEGNCIVKRVMKRRDLDGNKIRPTPIFNTGKTSFPFRYQYMLDDFPDDKAVSDMDIDSREYINIRRRVFDVRGEFERKIQKKQGQLIDTDFLEITSYKLMNYDNGKELIEELEPYIPAYYEKGNSAITVSDAISFYILAHKNKKLSDEGFDRRLRELARER